MERAKRLTEIIHSIMEKTTEFDVLVAGLCQD